MVTDARSMIGWPSRAPESRKPPVSNTIASTLTLCIKVCIPITSPATIRPTTSGDGGPGRDLSENDFEANNVSMACVGAYGLFNVYGRGTGSRGTTPHPCSLLATTPVGISVTTWCGWKATGSPGINVNAGRRGGAYLILASSQSGAGASSHSALYLIKCGYDENNFTAIYIAGDVNFVTFSQSGGVLHASATDGANYAILANF